MAMGTFKGRARRALAAGSLAVVGALTLSLGGASSAQAEPQWSQMTCQLEQPGKVSLRLTAALGSDLPVHASVGRVYPWITLATFTPDEQSAGWLRQRGVTWLSGSGLITYSVAGSVADPGLRSIAMTLAATAVRPSGDITVRTQATQLETASTVPGEVTYTFASFSIELVPDKGRPFKGTCTFDGANDVSTVLVVPLNDAGIGADGSNGLTQAGAGIAAFGALAAGVAVVRGRRRSP